MQLHLIIHGRVQGVGFRWRAKEEAERLHVTGWAQNNADSSITIVAEGDERSLKEFETTMRRGPRFAQIESMEVERTQASNRFPDFRIR